MTNKLLRYILLGVMPFLVSCKALFGPRPELEMAEVSIYTDLDVNDDSAIATDLVIVYGEDLIKNLEKMSACTYFAASKQLLMDNPTLLDIWHWEFVPGQSIQYFSPDTEKGKAFGAYVFANYLTPGEHRVKVAPDGVVKIVLTKDDLKDISSGRASDIRSGVTMSQPESFCPANNPELNKWPTIADALFSGEPTEATIQQGPVTTTTLISSPPPCTSPVKRDTPIVIKPLPFKASPPKHSPHKHHHHKTSHHKFSKQR